MFHMIRRCCYSCSVEVAGTAVAVAAPAAAPVVRGALVLTSAVGAAVCSRRERRAMEGDRAGRVTFYTREIHSNHGFRSSWWWLVWPLRTYCKQMNIQGMDNII